MTIQYRFFKQIGIKPYVITVKNRYIIHFNLTDSNNIRDIEKIRKFFPPDETPAILTFANKKPVVSFSPYTVSFYNYDNSSDAKICWGKGDFINSIKISPTIFKGIHHEIKRGKHLGFGTTKVKTFIFFSPIPGMGTQIYYGDSYTQYCDNSDQIKEFEKYIFTFKDPAI